MSRLIKAFWLLTLIVSLLVLLYTYASVPEEVVYRLDELGDPLSSVGREAFFYISLAGLVIANFSLYTVSKTLGYKKASINQLMTNWQLGLAGFFNVFFMVVWQFISLVNSGENFNYNNFGFLIYVAIAFVVLWVLALPVLLFRHQKSLK